jgi:hypothetical protein
MQINYINSHPMGSGEGEAVAPAASLPRIEGLPSFDPRPTVLLSVAPVQQTTTAPNNVHPLSAKRQPTVWTSPNEGEFPITLPDATIAVRDSHPGRATRTPVADNLDGAFADLDGILPDIAEDVFHGWERIACDV